MKFLIVDDSADMRMVNIDQLKETFPEAEYIEAEDGSQALGLYDFSLPDVVVTDRQMPRMGGEALARALLAKDRNIPIFMVTGDRTEVKDMSLFWAVFSKGSCGSLGQVIKERLAEKRKQKPRSGATKTSIY